MLDTLMLPPVAPPAEDQRPLSSPLARETVTPAIKHPGCSWVVDPATGTLRSQWGFGARR